MAIYHLNVRGIAPSRGSSAVASASYQSGQTLIDERTGERCKYAREERVVACGIELPDGVPEWASDRQRLWNEATLAHGGGTELVARRWEFALPRELSDDERKECVTDFCKQRIANGRVCDWAIHDDGNGNPHAHVLESALKIDTEGFKRPDAPKNEKHYLCRNADGKEKLIPASEWKGVKNEWAKVFRYRFEGDEIRLTKDEAKRRGLENSDRVSTSPVAAMKTAGGDNALGNAKAELKEVRKAWADIANKRLAEHAARMGTQVVAIDHRSFKERGVEYVPTVHEGNRPTPERMAMNKHARIINAAIERVSAQIATLKTWFVRKTDALTQRRAAFIARHRGLMLKTAAIKRAPELRRDIARTVEREIKAVFSHASKNHFNDLEAALKRRGISMDFTEDKKDLAFSSHGQTVTGTQMGSPLPGLIEASRNAGRSVSADELRHMTERAKKLLDHTENEQRNDKLARGGTITIELGRDDHNLTI